MTDLQKTVSGPDDPAESRRRALAAANKLRRDKFDAKVLAAVRVLRAEMVADIEALARKGMIGYLGDPVAMISSARAWRPPVRAIRRHLGIGDGGRENERVRGALARLEAAGMLDVPPTA